MRKIFLALLAGIIAFGFVMTDAQAKRMGGGKSIGVRHETSSFSRSKPTSAVSTHTAPAAAAKPASGASRWLGPLAGLAVGGLLASLFMQNGMGSGIMSWILIAAGIFLVWRLLRFFLSRRDTTQPMRFQSEPAVDHFKAPFSPQINQAVVSNVAADTTVVEDERIKNFDDIAFLRQAKTVFIRLQAANDTKNLVDLREFTSPELFAEIQMQMQERGDEPNFTEVVTINAELVHLTTDQNGIIARVQFSGLIREQQDAAPTYVKEIWNLYNDEVKQNWLVIGIQQA